MAVHCGKDTKGFAEDRQGSLSATLGHKEWESARGERSRSIFAEEFDCSWCGEQTCFCTALNELSHGLSALLAIAEGPFVDVHPHELIGQFRVHLARKLHGVVQCLFAMFEAVGNAVANRLSDLPADLWPESPANSVAAERERQAGLLLPPDAKVNYFVQSFFRKEELSFVNEQTRFHEIVLDGVHDSVEGHDNRFEIVLKKFQGEKSGSLQSGNRDALAGEFLWLA